MGGAASEVGEGTTDVVVESAIFDPISIRRTAFRYALRSEASLRFEKGQEFRLARIGADRTARLIAEWAGGEVAPGAVDSNPDEPAPARVAFRPARVNRLLGTDFATDEQRALLARVGIETEPAGPGTRVRIAAGTEPLDVEPGRCRGRRRDRPDLAARPGGRGRHRRGGRPRPRLRARPGQPAATRRCRRTATIRSRSATRVRETLAGAGLTEVVTFALVAPRLVERFPARDDGALDGEPEQRAGRPADHRHEPAVEPALGPPPEPGRQPARGRLDQPPPRPRRRRDLRGRQGLRRPGRPADARVVAARVRADRRGAAGGLGSAGRAPTTSTTRRAWSS